MTTRCCSIGIASGQTLAAQAMGRATSTTRRLRHCRLMEDLALLRLDAAVALPPPPLKNKPEESGKAGRSSVGGAEKEKKAGDGKPEQGVNEAGATDGGDESEGEVEVEDGPRPLTASARADADRTADVLLSLFLDAKRHSR